MISRRDVLAGGAGLGFAMSTGAARAQAVQIRISTAANEQDWLTRALQRLKENVERDLPGQLAISVHANSSLFRQGTELPALQRGNLEMSTLTTFEVEQQIPEFGVFSAGYVFRDYEHMRKVMAGPLGQEYAQAVASRIGVELVDTIYLGTRQVNLRTAREVRTPADLAGVKLRMPPGPGWTALGRGLGVTPTPMGMAEVYLALRSGTIDGQENPLALTRVNNLHEVTQQIVMTSHLVQPVFLAMAKPVWDRLTAAQKDVFKRHARDAAEFNDRGRLQDEQELVGFFRTAGLRVTTPDLDAFRASVARQYAEAGLTARWGNWAQRIADVR